MALSAKQIIFCETYAGNGGNATDAAKQAGYAKPAEQGYENIRKPHMAEYIAQLTKADNDKRIATAAERKEFWSSVMRGDLPSSVDAEGNETFDMKDKLKASELLGRSHMDFVEKRVVEIVNPADELERMKQAALIADKSVISTVGE